MNHKKIITKTILTLAAVTAGTHMINKMISYRCSKNTKDDFKSDIYKWRFGNIHYTKQGSGSPILLIHSLDHCSSDYEWHSIVNELSLSNTVYTLDLIGCGKSDKPNMTYTNFLYVQLLSDFIKEVIDEQTDVIVSSSSASLVIMTTQYNKNIINRIIISNPTDIASSSLPPTKLKKFYKTAINMPVFGTLIYNIITSKKFIYNRFIEQYYSDLFELEDSTVDIYYANAHYQNSKGKFLYSSIIANYTNINIINTLSNMNNSIYIFASNDSSSYLTVAENYKHYNSSIEILTVPGAQLPQLENPNEFIEQIKIVFDL